MCKREHRGDGASREVSVRSRSKEKRFGVNVSTAELEGDGYSEILTGAGPGAIFGPHVRGFNFDASTLSARADKFDNEEAIPFESLLLEVSLADR